MKKDNFLSYIFVFILIGVLIFTIIKQGLISLNIISFQKSDNWIVIEKTDDVIKDKIMSLEAAIENRVNNYFPFYNKINQIYYDLIMNIDGLYLNDIYLKENKDKESIFYNKKDNFYYILNNYSNKELNDRLDQYSNYYNNLSKKYPDVNFYIYLPLRYELTDIENIEKNKNILESFINKLDTNIKVYTLDSYNNKDYLNKFYKSDHHYNCNGAYIAYNDILDMFNKESNLDIKYKEVIDKYYGANAKSLLSKKVYDKFMVMDVDNSLVVNIKDDKFKPLNINKKDNIFYDYYVGYFNGQYDEVIYTNNDIDSDDNLIIISDSFAWQIDYLLAYSFKNTYVINLRYGKWLKQDLDLNNYLKDNNIKNVLFLQEAKASIYDGDNTLLDKRVK